MLKKLIAFIGWLIPGLVLMASSGEGDYLARFVIPIVSSSDDVEERPNGTIYVNSTDLELTYDVDNGNQLIGLRFQNIPLDQGAEIVSAYLQFTTDEVGSNATNVSIKATNVDNAPVFTSNNYMLSQRSLSTAAVNWQPAPWLIEGEQGANQRSPDIAALLREVINRPLWTKGNALAFVINGNGTRTAEAFDGAPNLAPQLIIDVQLPAPMVPVEGLLINELMAANASYFDAFGEADDWVELYNSADQPINIGGLYLTDNLNKLDKWQIAAPLEIPPKGFALLWADDNEEQGGLHSSFKLSADGEDLALVQKIGADFIVLDVITFGELPIDISYGRLTDGSQDWVHFVGYTPKASNNGQPRFLDADISFSLADGMYNGQQSLSMTVTDPTASIYYTLDGKVPDEQDPVYEGAILLQESTVVNARAYKPGFAGQKTASGVFLINESSDLPTLNIQLDPKYLWDNETGMYVTGTNGVPGFCSEEPRNWNQDWEYPGQLTLFEPDGREAFKVNAGVKIGGACSRGNKMKSFNFFLRKGEYGDEMVKYRLFDQLDINEFKRFKIRNGGNDFDQMLFRDGILHELMRGQFDMDLMAYRPVLVFLNGTYWGVYGLREFHNEDYIASHHPVDDKNLDIITNPFVSWREVKEGEAASFLALKDFVERQNLANPNNYKVVEDQIDMNEFLNYLISQIYMANYDWPANNMEIWRDRDNGKWRWLMFDLDASTNYGAWSQSNAYNNSLAQATATNGNAWPNGPESTLFLRKLLENSTFKNEFIQRSCSYSEIVFSPDRVNEMADRIQAMLEPEMPRHINRWTNNYWEWGWSNPSGGSMNAWRSYINAFKQFFAARPGYFYTHYRAYFNLGLTFELTINYDEQTPGSVVFHSNDFEVPYQYQGTYFRDVPIRIKAIPKPGYAFLKWAETGETNAEINFSATQNQTLTPLFVPTEPILTEVHYQPMEGDDYEFIEIYNATNDPIAIGGYQFVQGVSFTFPNNTILAPKSYAIIAKNPDLFSSLDCQVFKWSSGDLMDSGETIQLANASGQIVDEVSYSNEAPWPQAAAGNGPSIHLKEAYLRNELAENWAPAVSGGTPCEATLTGLKTPDLGQVVTWKLYPNPAKDMIYMEIETSEKTDWQFTLLNTMGQSLLQQSFETSSRAEKVSIPLLNLTPGVYLVKLGHKMEQLIQRIVIE